MARRSEPRSAGELEAEIIACLAAADAPMTPADVLAHLDSDLAYTTVLTTLTRLYGKNALRRTKRGRAYAYELLRSEDETTAGLTARQMRRLLDAGTDRAGVLARFVDDLDPEAERELRELLNRHPQRRSRR